jgi:hypothetical protein
MQAMLLLPLGIVLDPAFSPSCDSLYTIVHISQAILAILACPYSPPPKTSHLSGLVSVSLHEVSKPLYVGHHKTHASSTGLAQRALALLADQLRQAGHFAAEHMENLRAGSREPRRACLWVFEVCHS